MLNYCELFLDFMDNLHDIWNKLEHWTWMKTFWETVVDFTYIYLQDYVKILWRSIEPDIYVHWIANWANVMNFAWYLKLFVILNWTYDDVWVVDLTYSNTCSEFYICEDHYWRWLNQIYIHWMWNSCHEYLIVSI